MELHEWDHWSEKGASPHSSFFDTQFLGFDTQFLIFDTQFLVCDTQFLDFITTLHILVPSPQPVLVSFGSVCSTINTSDV